VPKESYSWRDVKNSYAAANKATNDLIAHSWFYLLRPISFRISAVFATFGVSPVIITMLGMLCVFVGVIMIGCSGNRFPLFVSGCVVLIFSNILDCVDGDVARVTNKESKIGEYLDFLSGVIFHTLVPVAAAVSIYTSCNQSHLYFSNYISNSYILLIAMVEVYATFMRVLLSLKGRVLLNYNSGAKFAGGVKLTFWKIAPRILANARTPLLLVALFLNLVELYLLIYMIYSILIMLATLIKCIKQAPVQ